MATRTLNVVISGDPKPFTRGIKDAESSLDRFGKSGAKSLHGLKTAAVAAGAAITTGLVVGGAKVIDMASDINESLTKNQELFGKHAKAVDTWSRGTAESMGISREAALEAAGVFGNLFVALDLGPKKSADMSRALVTLAGDLASFNNASPEEAMEAIRSGLVGETEPLRRFGVNLNDAALRTEALKLGLVKTTKEALTPQQKALAVNKLLFEQTDKAQGDFQRTSEGLANQQRILKADLSDVGAEAGEVLLPAVKDVASAMVDLVQGFRDGTGTGGQVRSVIEGVGGAAADAGRGIGGLVRGFQDGEGPARLLAAAITGVATAFIAFKVGGAVVAGIDATKKAWLAFAGPEGAVAKSPVGVVALAVAGLIGALGILSLKTRDNETSSRAFNDALNAQRDAMREVAGIELDEAQRKANVKSATVAVEQAEKNLAKARKDHGKNSLEARQAEADLRQARLSQKRASVDLANVEEDAKEKRRRLKDASKDLTKEEKNLNKSIDEKIKKREKEVDGIDTAIGRLKREGVQNDATRETVKKLRDRQRELNDAINGLKSKKVDVSVKFKLTPSPGSVFGTGGVGDGVGMRGAVHASVTSLAQNAVDTGRLLPVAPASLMGADPDLAPFAAVAAGMGLHTSSGIRPGSITSSGNVSYHSSGDAIDEAGPPSAMARFFKTMKGMFGSRLRELIYTGPGGGTGIKDGRPFTYTGQVAADHHDHVHLAYTGPFGDGIGQAANAAKAAGFSGKDLITAVAVAGPESSFHNKRRLHTSREDSRGMWQINTLAHPWAGRMNLYDAFVNARAARRVWREAGGSFRPWTGFTSGGYRSFMDDARKAVQGSSASAGGGGGVSLGGHPTIGGAGGGSFHPKGGELGVNEMDQALAALTPGSADDVGAARTAVQIWRRRLRRARRSGNVAAITEAAQNLKSARENLAGLTDTGATGGGDSGGGDVAAALTALTTELARTRQANDNLIRTQGPQIVNAVIAAVNGGIGGKVGLGFSGLRSPAGSVAGL